MEKIKSQHFNNVLCIKHYKKTPSEALLYTLPVSRTHHDKKAITNLQAELIDVKFKFNAVFNSLNSYHVIVDKRLNIVAFNKAYISVMASFSDKILAVGQNFASYLNADVFARVQISCERAIAGHTFTLERCIERKDKPDIWLLIEYSPAYNHMNRITGAVLNMVDITRRKNHEVKIEEQNKKLRDISLMQSHDIRAPLCTLMGLMELVKMDGLNEYIPMMDTTIALLDEKIRAIVDKASEEE